MNENRMMIGTTIDKATMLKAIKQSEKDFGVVISKMALIRMLIGVYAQGKIQLGLQDLAAHSPDTLRNRDGAERDAA